MRVVHDPSRGPWKGYGAIAGIWPIGTTATGGLPLPAALRVPVVVRPRPGRPSRNTCQAPHLRSAAFRFTYGAVVAFKPLCGPRWAMCQANLPGHWLHSVQNAAERARREAALDRLAVVRDGCTVSAFDMGPRRESRCPGDRGGRQAG